MTFFFFNETSTTEIYTLSLHDALPILDVPLPVRNVEEIPDDLLHVIGIGHGHHPHTPGPKHSMDLACRAVRGRRVFEDLDHEDVVERGIGKRKPARDIVNQDVGGGELGGDVESLILDVARQLRTEIAVAW